MIFEQIHEQLALLHTLLKRISNEQYTRKIVCLDNATIGGHSRHILELIKIVIDGYERGEVDYLNRERNLLLETDRVYAMHILQTLLKTVERPDRLLWVINETGSVTSSQKIQTSYFREIVYGVEHTIHHFALMKVALHELNIGNVEPHFGLAYATIQFRAKTEQKTA